jgi:hypothetical protein
MPWRIAESRKRLPKLQKRPQLLKLSGQGSARTLASHIPAVRSTFTRTRLEHVVVGLHVTGQVRLQQR